MMCSDLRQTYKQTLLRRGALDVALSDKVYEFMLDIYWTYSRSAYWTLFQKCVLNVIPEVRIERYSRSAYWTLFQKCVLNVIPEVRIERYSRSAYWTLFQKCVLHTKFDIYVLLLFLKNIIVLKTNVCGSLCVLWPLHCFSFLHFSHCIVNPSIYGSIFNE
jgi:hypothetical protein